MTGFFHHAFIKRDERKNEASNEANNAMKLFYFCPMEYFSLQNFHLS